MKSLIILLCVITAQAMFAQEDIAQASRMVVIKNKEHVKASFSDPHLQFKNIKGNNDVSNNSYHIRNSIKIFNKSYDTLFIIDKYGKHIFDLNIPTTTNELVEIPTSTWLNGSYEVIAIKNNEAYHHKIVKL